MYTGRESFGLAGIIGFYTRLATDLGRGQGTLLDIADKMTYPALGLFGGADQSIPVEQVHALDVSGVEHEIIIYPEAPHGFFDRRSTQFADASADAWHRVRDFIAAHNPRG